MNIGLDYDGTVTSDYKSFLLIAMLLREKGHKVFIVTMRYPSECINDEEFCKFARYVDGVAATSRGAKKPFCQNHGLHIDIWIDDNPQAVTMHAYSIWGAVSLEGTVVIENHSGSGDETHTMVIKKLSDDHEEMVKRINWIHESNVAESVV